jgi:LacI family transcriptional regulator
MDGVCRSALENGWILDTLYFFLDHLPSSWNGDGILSMLDIAGQNPAQTDFVKQHQHLPLVEMSINDASLVAPRVLQNNHLIGRMGAEHLASIGCLELGFALEGENHFHRERLEGFLEGANDCNLKARTIWVPTMSGSNEHANNWLLKEIPEEKPFGIMAGADYLARRILDICLDSGVSVPEDVALIGVDNTQSVCELSPVQLSSIDNNAYLHGYEAASLLHQLMESGKTNTSDLRVAPGALYSRQSSNLLATSHPHVASALNIISKSFRDPNLTAQRVAENIPMSERRLHDAFLRTVKRSIFLEILDRRINYAKKLIRETDLKFWDIAEQSGFASLEGMSRTIKRRTGHPPSYFRMPK